MAKNKANKGGEAGMNQQELALVQVAREVHHIGRAEVVTLDRAAYRFYGLSKVPRKEDGLFWPEWRHMRLIYEKTKGRSFVFEPEGFVLDACGVRDVGPLFVWPALWRFAGCPEPLKGKGNAGRFERPTWKPCQDGVGVDFWCTATSGNRAWCVAPRWWVAKLRAETWAGRKAVSA